MQAPETAAQDDNAARRLAAIVESSEDGILSKDLNGIVTSWNRGAERIFGYTTDEVVGRSVTLLLPPDRYDEEPDILARIRSGARVEHYTTVRRRKDGTLIDVSLSVSPVKDRTGAIVGAASIMRDITAYLRAQRELQAARDELRRQNEALESHVAERTRALRDALDHMEEFSYSVSHDLRSPVRAIEGYASALLQDYGERMDDPGRDYLRRIISSSHRMDVLIRELLAYSHLSYAEIRPQRVALANVVREVIASAPDSERMQCEVTVEGDLHTVLGHYASLLSVVYNLLDNARKFVAAGTTPRVRVWSERIGRQVRLFVEDNGIGIKPEYQHRLFSMFERVHPAHMYDGSGVGLAMVRKAVERMDGAVGVESDGMNGSRFWIQLPTDERE